MKVCAVCGVVIQGLYAPYWTDELGYLTCDGLFDAHRPFTPEEIIRDLVRVARS